jgi:autotransporter-associated beta strand protein
VPLRIASCIVAFLIGANASLAGYPPTAYEQYMLELVNRLRLDPDGEVYRLRDRTWGDTDDPQPPDLNEGITTGLLTSESRQPLAFNASIIQTARDYSQTLLDHDDFTHYYAGTSPKSRMEATGYVFSAPYTWGENLALTYSNYPLPINGDAVASDHDGLFIDGDVDGRGHRKVLLNADAKEIGIGIVNTSTASYTPPGVSGNWYALISTQNFAASGQSAGGKAFLTGVAYSDAGGDNNFYDIGEGLANVIVTATPVGGGASIATTTWTPGGYSLPLPAGTYNVTFSGGGLPASIVYANVAIGSKNVKLDASSDQGVWNINASGDWSAGNWSGIMPHGTGHNAVFAGKATAPRTVSLAAPRTVGTITFNNASANYTVAGPSTLSLQLTADRARVFVHAGHHSISAPVSLLSGLDVTVLGAADSLALSGPIASPASQSIAKLGKGTLWLWGDNSFGGLAIADGTVRVGHNNGLGAAPVTLGFGPNDATLLANAGVTVPNAVDVAVGAGGARTIGTTATAGIAAFSGRVTLGNDLILTAPAGGQVLLSGNVDGPGGLIKTGAGTAVLAQLPSHTGNTSVEEGVLEVLGLNGDAHTTVAGTLIADTILQSSLTILAGGLVELRASDSLEMAWAAAPSPPVPSSFQQSAALTTVPAPVPEPAAWLLALLFALAGVARWRR